MSPAEIILHVTVFRATETTAVITNAIVRAAHGAQAQRTDNLDRAICNAEYLVDCLKTAKLRIEQKQPQTSDVRKGSQP